jgi:hypothetical protein
MKLQANELRIGNNLQLTETARRDLWDCCEVQTESNIVSVEWINKDEIGASVDGESHEFEYNDINPIPLTEEWLVKTDLIKDGILYEKGKFAIKPWEVGHDIEWVIFWGDKAILYEKEYKVHQLQNLYFALTGKELNTKH